MASESFKSLREGWHGRAPSPFVKDGIGELQVLSSRMASESFKSFLERGSRQGWHRRAPSPFVKDGIESFKSFWDEVPVKNGIGELQVRRPSSPFWNEVPVRDCITELQVLSLRMASESLKPFLERGSRQG